ncbi:tetratricopeptide repeat protein [Alphaproteobacteria bacterium]|nr:tetratricopeptide repeat protein [Alphaproteobacteria bacterium]
MTNRLALTLILGLLIPLVISASNVNAAARDPWAGKSDDHVCNMAQANGKWATDYYGKQWAHEAKQRGLNCGMGGDPSPAEAANAENQYRNGLELAKNNELADAEAVFTLFIEANRDHKRTPDALFWLGRVQFMQGKYERAAMTFSDFNSKNPYDVRVPDTTIWIADSVSRFASPLQACEIYKALPSLLKSPPSDVFITQLTGFSDAANCHLDFRGGDEPASSENVSIGAKYPKYSDKRVCREATEHDGKNWEIVGGFWVQEAKRRGLSCNVQSDEEFCEEYRASFKFGNLNPAQERSKRIRGVSCNNDSAQILETRASKGKSPEVEERTNLFNVGTLLCNKADDCLKYVGQLKGKSIHGYGTMVYKDGSQVMGQMKGNGLAGPVSSINPENLVSFSYLKDGKALEFENVGNWNNYTALSELENNQINEDSIIRLNQEDSFFFRCVDSNDVSYIENNPEFVWVSVPGYFIGISHASGLSMMPEAPTPEYAEIFEEFKKGMLRVRALTNENLRSRKSVKISEIENFLDKQYEVIFPHTLSLVFAIASLEKGNSLDMGPFFLRDYKRLGSSIVKFRGMNAIRSKVNLHLSASSEEGVTIEVKISFLQAIHLETLQHLSYEILALEGSLNVNGKERVIPLLANDLSTSLQGRCSLIEKMRYN